MSQEPIDFSLPEDFNRVVRLFPLPSVVLFPGVVQALHIFEPRYREMLQHCIDTDQLITMAKLNRSLPETANGDPAIDPVVCIGRVLSSTELDDGTSNLFLVGIRRATVVNELETSYPYRIAQVDVFTELPVSGALAVRNRLLTRFQELMELVSGTHQAMLDQFQNHDLPLNQLVDIMSYVAGFEPDDQQAILATFDLEHRAELLLDLLEQRQLVLRREREGGSEFPPGFSLN